ncbi:recombinase family protein [Thalassorhabdus alkalitolerans]|uniref:Recombinase family protein n=1 Tax=Thalassorhabdus alkalitolerans TaxID=2282697 RepID=A0ABW0YTJ5_9BACI
MNVHTSSASSEYRFIAIYCRVSTDDQVKEGTSLEDQESRLLSYCTAMGWKDTPVLFIDDGYSAKDTDRPQLKKLVEAVKNGEVSKVLVTKLDRISRKLLDLLNLIDLFSEYDVSFISINESFDTNTPPGRLTLSVLGAVAEFERTRIRDRAYENMLHSAKKGKWLTQSPYGYRLEEKTLVIHENEANIVRDIYNMYLHKGLGFYAIARQLNEKGIPSRYNKEWSLRAVKLLLTNPIYKGTLAWNRVTVDEKHGKRVERDKEDWVIVDDAFPSIINKETWEDVQKKMKQVKIAPRAQTSPHLLGGILKCGRCGSGMSISWSGSKTKRYRLYRCSAYKNKGTCTSKPYRANKVEEWFKEGFKQLSTSIDTEMIPQLIETQQNETINNREKKLKNAEERYKRKVEAYTSGLIELSDLEKEKKQLDKVKEEASVKPDKIEQENLEKLQRELESKIKSIIDAIEILPVEETKPLLHTFVKKVIVYNEEEIEIVLHY